MHLWHLRCRKCEGVTEVRARQEPRHEPAREKRDLPYEPRMPKTNPSYRPSPLMKGRRRTLAWFWSMRTAWIFERLGGHAQSVAPLLGAIFFQFATGGQPLLPADHRLPSANF